MNDFEIVILVLLFSWICLELAVRELNYVFCCDYFLRSSNSSLWGCYYIAGYFLGFRALVAYPVHQIGCYLVAAGIQAEGSALVLMV